MNLYDELSESASEILETNLSFYRNSRDDTNRYVVGPEVLASLSWVAVTIALPILMSAVNEAVKIKISEWLKKRKESSNPELQPSDSIQQELANILQAKGGIAITSVQISDAVNVVAEYLSYRGWPKALAQADAKEIVNSIQENIGQES